MLGKELSENKSENCQHWEKTIDYWQSSLDRKKRHKRREQFSQVLLPMHGNIVMWYYSLFYRNK